MPERLVDAFKSYIHQEHTREISYLTTKLSM